MTWKEFKEEVERQILCLQTVDRRINVDTTLSYIDVSADALDSNYVTVKIEGFGERISITSI